MKVYVSDLKEGKIDTLFFVLRKEELVSGEIYIFRDKTGIIEGFYSGKSEINENDFVQVIGDVVQSNGKLKINIQKIEKIDESKIDIFDFLPSTKRNINEMMTELNEIIESIKDENLKSLLKIVFNEKFIESFKLCPGAVYYHHNYLGGLLEHTLSVARICEEISKFYGLNRDLLVAGALLHDIGKTREYEWFPKFSVTKEGGFSGHAALGAHMLSKVIPDGFPEDLKIKLYHMILSHHGEM
ncbi:MAG: HD domain-containing protein, partial [Candidatus Micrarchaeia archaeon]